MSNWKEVVELNPKGYVELQDMRSGMVFHGPLESLVVDDMDFVVITLEWVAQMPQPGKSGFGTWKRADDKHRVVQFPNHTVGFVVEDTPGKGRRVRFGGTQILYIDKFEGVDPSKVEGLELKAS